MGLVQIVNSIEEIPKSSQDNTDYNDIWCFTLDYEEEAQVVMLNDDNNIPIVDAVELYTPGKPTIRAAVLASSGKDCPFTNLLEETGNTKFRPKKFFVFSVLDLRGYTNKNGEKKKEYVRRACLVKGHMMDKFFKKKLLKHIDKHGSLRGSRFDVSRGPNMNPSPPSCGDMWEFDQMVDISEFENAELLTEDEVLSLFVTGIDELKELAAEWRNIPAEAPRAKY